MRPSERFSAQCSAYLKLGRFHSLSGAFYLLVPCWWGLALGMHDLAFGKANTLDLASFLFVLPFVLLFALAAFAARAAGCAWNDLLDCSIDKKTARTRARPLPKGDLSRRQALLFVLFALLVCGACLLGLLALAAHAALLLLLVFAVLPVAGFYPLAKRFFFAPQIVLGIAFNWGILCANVALAGSLSFSALTLWLGGVAWTTFYDSIYAWQDLEDDRRTKMKSLTLWLVQKKQPKIWLATLYTFFLASVFVALSLSGEQNSVLWLACLLVLALWCYTDLSRLLLSKPQECMAFFRKECWRTGGSVLLLLLVATFL